MRVFIYYLASLAQGFCLILLPSTSFIFTSPRYHQLSDQQYGLLFLPEIIGSIVTMLGIPWFLHRMGRTHVYYFGLGSNLIYLVLMLATAETYRTPEMSFWLLMTGNFFLGTGFGLLITVMNIFVVELFPEKRDGVTTGLHGTLGLGAALAPVAVNFFFERKIWTGGCALAFALILVIMAVSFWQRVVPEPALIPVEKMEEEKIPPIPFALWLFPAAAFFYGITESIVGNWSTAYLNQSRAFSLEVASYALALFWALMTAGRLGAGLLTLRIDARKLYWISPFVMMASLQAILKTNNASSLLWAYAGVGLGCSYFLPLTISLSTQYFDEHRDLLPGLVMAGLMSGVGVGTFGTGFLSEHQVLSLEQVFLCSILSIGISGFIAIFMTHHPHDLKGRL
ncbi:MAG: MFS transporter [Candidatus Omnitrophica bacterium]|nr:MFS transporter [Candidatus Omnitrophota bacterium]